MVPAAVERNLFQRFLAARETTEKLAGWRAIAIDRLPSTGPLLLVFRSAAAGDPEIVTAWAEYEERRHRDSARIVASCAHLLREGLSVQRATDVYRSTFTSDTEDLFVRVRGWSLEEYADWLVDALDRLLFA